MRWRGRRQSSNIDDRRGRIGMRAGLPRGRVARGGGLGIGTIAIALVAAWVFGIDPNIILGLGGAGGPTMESSGPAPKRSAREEELASFARVVLADTEDTWGRIFREGGSDYREPTLTMFTGQVSSACGFASAASGPFYCPGDQRVYLDLGFYDQLARKLNSPGDFAQAYVLAHEVGHHVQNLLGILPEFNRIRRGMAQAEANALSVRIELQADCFAGIWANHAARQRDFLERGDIEEGLNAASQIGDDTLQRRSQGYVVPESFNHGTSAQRVRWFRRGLKEGRLDACDTLNARDL